MRVVPDRILRPNLFGDLRKARLDGPLPELAVEVSAGGIRIRRQDIVPHRQRQVHPIQKAGDRQRRLSYQRAEHGDLVLFRYFTTSENFAVLPYSLPSLMT